jgi:hypothetical protein
MNLPAMKKNVGMDSPNRIVKRSGQRHVNPAIPAVQNARGKIALRLLLGSDRIEVVGQFFPFDYRISVGNVFAAYIHTRLVDNILEISLVKTGSLLRPELLDHVCSLMIAESERPGYPHYSYSFEAKGWNFRTKVAHNNWMEDSLRVLGFKRVRKPASLFGRRLLLTAKATSDLEVSPIISAFLSLQQKRYTLLRNYV